MTKTCKSTTIHDHLAIIKTTHPSLITDTPLSQKIQPSVTCKLAFLDRSVNGHPHSTIR